MKTLFYVIETRQYTIDHQSQVSIVLMKCTNTNLFMNFVQFRKKYNLLKILNEVLLPPSANKTCY